MQQHTDFFRFARDITDSVLKACDGKEDAIVATLLGVSTCQVARERDIPFFYVVPLPSLCTQDFPNPMFPPFSLGRAYNRWTFNMANGFFARSYEYARCLFQEPRPPYLFCFSSHVVPRPSDWGEYAHVTGYWFSITQSIGSRRAIWSIFSRRACRRYASALAVCSTAIRRR